MLKYQFIELREKNRHAGSKARGDVALFAEQEGYKPLYIKCRKEKNDSKKERILRFVTPVFSWIKGFLSIKKNSLVIVQNPFYMRHLGREKCLKLLKTVKKCRIISIIHDVERLRGKLWSSKNLNEEFEFMKSNSDVFIVHNDSMKDAFIKMGFPEEKLVVLEIFDYFTDKKPRRRNLETAVDIVISGNLNPQKSPYVYRLKDLKNKFSINLYGPNYEGEKENDNIHYLGSFPPDEIPSVIEGKFGLVWDGENLDTCEGGTGEYLKYNNPHKTSLYLVAGLPVIIWKKSAMAKFIEREKVGFTVNSLEEIKNKINSMPKEEYDETTENATAVSARLSSGYYLKKALASCEKKLAEK